MKLALFCMNFTWSFAQYRSLRFMIMAVEMVPPREPANCEFVGFSLQNCSIQRKADVVFCSLKRFTRVRHNGCLCASFSLL